MSGCAFRKEGMGSFEQQSSRSEGSPTGATGGASQAGGPTPQCRDVVSEWEEQRLGSTEDSLSGRAPGHADKADLPPLGRQVQTVSKGPSVLLFLFNACRLGRHCLEHPQIKQKAN